MSDLPTPPLPSTRPTPSPDLLAARELVRRTGRVVILTGAGVSAESGVPTFRGPAGHWRQFRPEDLATPEAFRRDPCLVWSWYDHRRRALADCTPNPGHGAVARYLEANPEAHLVTQNVDGLHQRAMGSADPAVPHPRIHELHGSIARLRCSGIGGSGPGCDWAAEDPRQIDAEREESLPRCPSPGCGALLRPDVVWFGEMLPQGALSAAFEAASRAEVCVVAGTSALVHPAASVPLATLRAGGTLVEVNPEATPLSPHARWCLRGRAGDLLPVLLAVA